MNTLGVGIVGYGGFGPFLKNAWSQVSGIDVRMVADTDPGRKPDPSTRFTTDWTNLITDPNIDIIAVVTPPSTHAEIAIAAMKAGKHVLVDKPLATTIEDARKIIDERNRTGNVAAVNFMLRFNPLVEALIDWSRSGLFGQLRHAAVENVAQDESLPPGHWFWDPAVSGGILVEHAGHFADLVDAVAGRRPETVQGARRTRNDRQEDQVLATALYDGGLIATHYHEFSRPRPLETTSIRLIFELAQVDLNGWIPLGGEILAMAGEVGVQALHALPGWKTLEDIPADSAKDSVTVHSAGKPYLVSRIVRGTFTLPEAKLEVYAACLQKMMADVGEAVRNSKHRVRVPLEDGLYALDTALRATVMARTAVK
ncbi:MAG: Gfo/Idh/MocA family oxidoreductase [bacterium]